MKFARLQLRPYGAFEDLALDFSQAEGSGGLHLVYGPNGAGKSTTLDALRSALFGIQFRGDDRKDFRFGSATLRIGAHLVRDNGEELQFLRRTSPKTPLWDDADETALDLERITPFLGNLDRDRFETLFGLDLETMVRGGQDLLKGEGDIGRALFGAGLGGQQLAETFERLDAEVRSLWIHRSPKSRINGLVAEHRQLTTDAQKAIKVASSYDSDRRELRRLRKESTAEQIERGAALRDVEALERLARAATILGPLEAKSRERQELGAEPALEADTAKRVLELLEESTQLARDAASRETRIRSAEMQRVGIHARANADHLAAAADVDALGARRGTFRDAVSEIETARRELAEATAARDEAARRSGVDAGEQDPAPAARGSEDLLDVVEQHRERLQQLELERVRCAKEQKRAVAAARRGSETLAGFDDHARETFALALEELLPWSGTVAELAALSVPSTGTVETHVAESASFGERGHVLQREQASLDDDENEALGTIARLEQDPLGLPPTADELRKTRAERDLLIRDALDLAISGEGLDRAAALAAERAIAAADHVMDRIVGQSRRFEEQVACATSLQRIAARRAALKQAEEELGAAETAAQQSWRGLWTDGALARQSPTEMKVWLERRRALLERVDDARGVARASADAARVALDERTADLEATKEELAAAEAAWATWAEARGLDPEAGPEAARKQLQGLVDIRSHEREMQRAEARLAKESEVLAAYTRDVADACERLKIHVDGPLAATGTGATDGHQALTDARITALLTATESAKRAEAELATLDRQLATEHEGQRLEAARIKEIDQALDEIATSARLASRADLIERARIAGRIHSVETELRDLELRFAEAAGEHSVDEIRTTIAGRAISDMESEVAALRGRITSLEESSAARSKRVWELEALVEGTGSAEAAALGSRLAVIESELVEATETYLQARVARALLDREVDRYRQETQGPLLERAQQLFEILTLGAYVKLHPSESKGLEVMVARRPDGRTVHVEGMSTGTRDQLYLALRIASVEHMLHVAKVEPMPFIADDLFVNFDDDRTEAALRVLAELSRSTQVIVFTHHASVVATARRMTDEGVPVHVLELEAEAAREAARTSAPE